MRTNTSKVNTAASSSAKALVPENECSLCRGARFVYARTPQGEIDYSRTIPCYCVDIVADKEKSKRLVEYSHLGTLRLLTFENLLAGGRHGSLQCQAAFKAAYEAALIFAAKPTGFLVFTGPSGAGKTHLAAAIINRQIEAGHAALYRSAPDLMDDLRATFSTDADSAFTDIFDHIKNTSILVLDDLGIQSDTAWAREKLDQLITYRFKQELPTVLVTAVSPESWEERLKNRITDPRLSKMFRLVGHDAFGSDWPEGLTLQKKMTFLSFDHDRLNLPTEERENLGRAYQVAYDFARSPEGWLILQGVTGCGKTHLASAIINFRYQTGLSALFIVVPEFLDHLRSTFSPDSRVSYDEMFDKVKTTPFLVLDDFGEQASTPWAQEKLYQVVSYRYNAQLPTVVTTRATLDEIEPAISSRFIDHQFSMVFNITAPDYRGDAGYGKSRRLKTQRPAYKKNQNT